MRKRNRGVEIQRTEKLFNVLKSMFISQWPCGNNRQSPLTASGLVFFLPSPMAPTFFL
jgi:hypothetical protein